MKVLVTGSKGFIGQNLCVQLKEMRHQVFEFEKNDSLDDLRNILSNCDFIYHLAGVNRPKNPKDYYIGNTDLTETIIKLLEEQNLKIPIVLSSSIQAEKDNDYGISKSRAEQYIANYGDNNGVPCYIFRLSNIFGKWSRPNYNSVIATFCYKIARDQEIEITNTEKIIPFVYIDDVVNQFCTCLEKDFQYSERNGFLTVEPIYERKLGYIATLLKSFRSERKGNRKIYFSDEFDRKLYSTYMSFIPKEDLAYKIDIHEDTRGRFLELFQNNMFGQISILSINPSESRGNHWHHSKTEKFIVLDGEALIKFHSLQDNSEFEYLANSNSIQMFDIPPGYSHAIKNIGKGELIVLIWASELYDPNDSDTYIAEEEK